MDADEFGADETPPDEGAWPTPGQLLAKLWNATREQRLDMARKIITNAQDAHQCLARDHVGELRRAEQDIRDLQRQLDDLTTPADLDPPKAGPVD